MIQEIAEHSVDIDLLQKEAFILDVGCRGFIFTDKMKELGHIVMSIDIEVFPDKEYDRIAITDYIGRTGIARPHDPQAMHIIPGDEIECTTLAQYSERKGVGFWDLIKIDIEGAEFKVIMSLEKAPAKQISVEFHLHTGIYKEEEVRMMENKLKALGYEAARHVYEAKYCAGFNYWDSLFILK